ncbi:choice-of-anchor A domain-containing protein/LPXTG-motif cell wall-anchored protein [Conyzicola nivalis]|uniref:Choice-of-anchor A domain-containing protein/LPXTG-motif cell wall-anchored protein n=1 Tax=Conyzicola nivalis TaxID=1477021 RepID=A0ABV2QSA3_9MICO
MSIAAVAAPALSVAPAMPASAAGPALCAVAPGLVYPNLDDEALQYDSAVNVMIGGDFAARVGAAEAEGVVLVGGSATFDTTKHYSVGVAGVGSRVAPPPGSDMLVTGGDVTVASGMLDVGSLIGGDIVSGGVVGPRASIETSGGTITENAADPLLPYAATLQGYRDLSTTYSAMSPNAGGTVTSTGWDVTFRGDGTANRQVFTVAGTDLGALGATKTMVFDNIPAGTIVIVNVTGPTAVIGANSFVFDGQPINPVNPVNPALPVDPLFSNFTQSLLWNFPTAVDVTLGDEDQLLGSILIPQPTSTTTVKTSTNGRFYAAGDVVMSGSPLAGLEFHSYPFRETSCGFAAVGSVSISKTLDDRDAVVPAGRMFTGGYTCVDASGSTVQSGTWSLSVGQTFVTPSMPQGSSCVVTENTPAPPSATDASYRWQPAAISPAAAVVRAGTPVAVTVLNTVSRAVGDLEMIKVLDDPYDVVDLSRVYTGTFACSYLGADLTPPPGTWAERAGAAPVRLATGLPAGTTCTLTEDPILVPPLPGFPQYHWAAPQIAPASVTIVENTVARIVVTNIVEDPVDPIDPVDPVVPVDTADPVVPTEPAAPTAAQTPVGVLAYTGAETAGPLLVAAVMVLLGLAGLAVKRRNRRISQRR